MHLRLREKFNIGVNGLVQDFVDKDQRKSQTRKYSNVKCIDYLFTLQSIFPHKLSL